MSLSSHLYHAFFIISQTLKGATKAVYWINFFFTLLFTIEAILKITALHPVVHTCLCAFPMHLFCAIVDIPVFVSPLELFQKSVEFPGISLHNWSSVRVHSPANCHQ